MKTLNNLGILNTSRILTAKELEGFRTELSHFLNLNGIISLCLEKDSLYVEYNSTEFSLEKFIHMLIEVDFPWVGVNIKLASVN